MLVRLACTWYDVAFKHHDIHSTHSFIAWLPGNVTRLLACWSTGTSHSVYPEFRTHCFVPCMAWQLSALSSFAPWASETAGCTPTGHFLGGAAKQLWVVGCAPTSLGFQPALLMACSAEMLSLRQHLCWVCTASMGRFWLLPCFVIGSLWSFRCYLMLAGPG